MGMANQHASTELWSSVQARRFIARAVYGAHAFMVTSLQTAPTGHFVLF